MRQHYTLTQVNRRERAHLVDTLLGARTVGEDDLDVHVVVRIVPGLRIALLVLAQEEHADQEHQNRADHVAYPDDRPRDVVSTHRRK